MYKMNPFQGYSGNQFTTSDGKLNNKDIQLKLLTCKQDKWMVIFCNEE